MPTAKVNDITMYYEAHGAGAPLVLINGLGADSTFLTPITKELAKHYRVIVFDNRGTGRTDKPDIPYSMDMMANDTVGLLQKLGIQRATIVGISMGGRIALSIALDHPTLVDKLILVSTSARGYGKLKMSWQFHILQALQWLPVFKGAYAQPAYAHARQRQATVTFNCVDALHTLQIPTLILHGKKDKSIPLALAEEMHTHIKDSHIVTFSGGHIFFLMRERSHFLRAISTFINNQ